MRLLLALKSIDNNSIPVNYNYPLSAAIYKLLKFGSKEFSKFLHDVGFVTRNKTYKLFTFALKFDKYSISKNQIKLHSPMAKLYISTPLVDDFLKNVVVGSFKNQTIEIASEGIRTTFAIEQMEGYRDYLFTDNMKFYLYSPLVLSTFEKERSTQQYYFRFSDDIRDISRVFNNNLFNKFRIVHGEDYKGEPLRFCWDQKFINDRLAKHKRITKMVSVSPSGIKPINIIANNAPFSLEGDPKLIKVGYDCGFGEKNSLGFGMAGILE